MCIWLWQQEQAKPITQYSTNIKYKHRQIIWGMNLNITALHKKCQGEQTEGLVKRESCDEEWFEVASIRNDW